jgi:excisionase family DNA binding protein
MELPALVYSSEHRSVVWKIPGYTSVLEILTHPVYSGAYSHGRTETQVRIENGRKIVKKGCRKKMEDWSILIVDHHEGYISWEEYCSNREIIEGNANMKGMLVRGSARSGEALLVGLLRCGHCGRKLQVHYSGKEGKVIRYRCKSEPIAHSKRGCIAFGGTHVEEAVSRELFRVLDSVGLEAAISACQQTECRLKEKREQLELALEQARYEVKRAWRQYDAVDPDNRLVATELEHRWNAALGKEKALEKRLELLCEEDAGVLEEDRANLLSLANDLPFVWNYPASSPELRKRILRTVLKEVVVNVKDGKICLVLHWEGGDHSEVEVVQRRSGQHRFVTEVETERLIQELSRMMPDSKLAALLNRLGKRTARGYSWTQGRVCAFRNDRSIPVYKEGERQLRGELTLDEAARFLRVSAMTVRRLIKRKILPAKQICVGAPWVIVKKDLSLMDEKETLGEQTPLTGNEKQQALNLTFRASGLELFLIIPASIFSV